MNSRLNAPIDHQHAVTEKRAEIRAREETLINNRYALFSLLLLQTTKIETAPDL